MRPDTWQERFDRPPKAMSQGEPHKAYRAKECIKRSSIKCGM